jgi:uncharacterized FlaG/YvyC family protein
MIISSTPNVGAIAHTPGSPLPQPASQDQREVIQAVKAVNAAALFGEDNQVTFLVDRNTHKAMVRIVNKSTHEMVAQIPSETVLRMAEEIK